MFIWNLEGGGKQHVLKPTKKLCFFINAYSKFLYIIAN